MDLFLPRARRRAAALALILFPVAPLSAGAHAEIGRLTMGRTTYPARSWIVNAAETYTASNLSDPVADTFASELEVKRGVTDRLTLEFVLETREARRDRIQADRLGAEALCRLLDRPFQLAANLEVLPSLHGEAPEVGFGFEVMHNHGPSAFLLRYEGEADKEEGEGYQFAHRLEPSAFYRFGLHGLVGTGLEIQPAAGAHSLALSLGGSVSKNIFLAVQPRFAITSRASDFALHLQLQLYFGPYGLGSWGLK